MTFLQVLLVAGMALVVLALLGCWVGEVFGLNGRLDAADEEERARDCLWPDRIDQRRD